MGLLAASLLALASCHRDSGDAGSTTGSSTARGTAAATAGTPPSTVAPAAAGKLLGSCMIAGIACSDYYGSSGTDTLKSACQMVGKWNDGACPTGNVQGTCTKPEPGGITNRAHTYPPGTRASAMKACGNTPGGVFSQ